MAIIGTCTQPHPDFVSVGNVPAPRAQAFPVLNPAWGFCKDVENAVEPTTGIGPPSVLAGALNPENSYLEPTIGQIWPR